jgi:hypothetical protein
LEVYMKRPVAVESASRLIDEKIKELGDWRGKTLAKVREIIHEADPEIVEEWKWRGTPVWSHGGIVCTGETYKNVFKMTFAKGAALEDPSGLFNSSLHGNVRRAIDIHEGDKVDEAALNPSADGSSALRRRSISRARASHATGRYVASRSPGERCHKSALMTEAGLIKTDERLVGEALATIDKLNACGVWGWVILPAASGLLHLRTLQLLQHQNPGSSPAQPSA